MSEESNNDEDAVSRIARSLAKDISGYSSSTRHEIRDDDVIEESRIMAEDGSTVDQDAIKSIDLCKRMDCMICEA